MNPMKKMLATTLALLCVTGSAFAVTWEQISPFSAEDLWLMKQAKTLIEKYQVDGGGKKEVDERTKVHGALRGLVQSFGDPYTRFVTPQDLEEEEMQTEGKYGGIGLTVSERDGQIIAVSPTDDTPAWHAGFRPNDQIVKVNDEVVMGKPLNEVVRKLRGEPGTKVTVWVRREGEDQLLEMPMTRELIHLESVKSTVLPQDKKVGYIRLSQFIATSSADFKKALSDLQRKGVKGLVLDLRNNGGGLLQAATEICDFFLEDGPIVETRGRVGASNEKFNATKGVETDLPLVILVNGGSASASEIVSGALRDRGRALLVGEKTFGKGSVQTLFHLNDASGIYVTIARYFTPGGELIDHVGLTPNREVKEPELKPMTDAEREQRKKDQKAYDAMTKEQRKAENQRLWMKSLGEDPQLEAALKDLKRLMKGETIAQVAPYTPKPTKEEDAGQGTADKKTQAMPPSAPEAPDDSEAVELAPEKN